MSQDIQAGRNLIITETPGSLKSYNTPLLGASPNFTVQIDFAYKPMYMKQISGMWLLVAGKDPSVEMYSA